MGQYDKTVGVLLLGIFLNTYLYGFVTYQFIIYWNLRFKEPLWIRISIVTLFVLDTANSVVGVYSAWETCVSNYNNPAFLLDVSWTIPFTACASATIAFISQIFLSHRVMALTKNKLLTCTILILSIVGCFCGNYAGVYSATLSKVTNFAPLVPYVVCWLGAQTAADLAITVTLTVALKRSRTGFYKTDSIINRFIRGAVQTGFFVSLFAMADLISFLFYRETNFYMMFAYPMGRIYTNTLLDTLIARRMLSDQVSAIDIETEGNSAALCTESISHANGTNNTIDLSSDERSLMKYRPDRVCSQEPKFG